MSKIYSCSSCGRRLTVEEYQQNSRDWRAKNRKGICECGNCGFSSFEGKNAPRQIQAEEWKAQATALFGEDRGDWVRLDRGRISQISFGRTHLSIRSSRACI